jgi:hypothetical protein
MDTTQATYDISLPALDPFGGPHFASDEDEDKVENTVAWTGDPSSVPLADADADHRIHGAGDELDAVIFAALVTA